MEYGVMLYVHLRVGFPMPGVVRLEWTLPSVSQAGLLIFKQLLEIILQEKETKKQSIFLLTNFSTHQTSAKRVNYIEVQSLTP